MSSKINGDIYTDENTLYNFSHDTSLFEVLPQAVIFPKNVEDVKKLVKFVAENKKSHPSLSITPRSAGTDMSGGAINDSLILVFEKYYNEIGEVNGDGIKVRPGAYYRDFEKMTLKKRKLMPAYPASRDLCAVGGMVANNAGGEKSLIYGKVENYIKSLKVVLADGNEYEIKPLSRKELSKKMAQKDFEGQIYKKTFQLIENHYDEIKKAKPNVSKNSTGYKIWDVWDRDRDIFDLTQIFVGSQGTLGLITEINFKLVDAPKHSGVLVGYARDLDHMAEIIQILKRHNPTSVEAFDEYTLKFAFKFFLQFREGIGWLGLAKLAIRLIPDALILLRGIPRMIFLASFDSNSYDDIKHKIDSLRKDIKIKHWRITLEEAENEEKSERFWMMRRKSFKLLRDNVKDKHTAPFIDDLVVPPENLAEFWPKLKKIMDSYELLYTIAGHLGDGNFHIIPLMDLADSKERAKIEPCLNEVIDLVKKYNGVISGEHNDGLIRSPFLDRIYSPKIVKIFREVKTVFDPQNIFNPHKKTDSNWQWSKKHMRKRF